MNIRRKLTELIKKYNSCSLLVKISFWVGVLSFFVSIKLATILCVISGLITIADKARSTKKLRPANDFKIGDITNAISSDGFKASLQNLSIDANALKPKNPKS